jgi:hypothetical protein
MTDTGVRVRAGGAGCAPSVPMTCGPVGEASNMALERPAGSLSLATAAHRRR